MFPLMLVALGLGALAAYGLSAHASSVKGATDAHEAAQAHLALAAAAPAPHFDEVQRNLDAAKAATRASAQKAADAAKAASTPKERAVAALVADRTLAIQDQVQALSDLALAASTHHVFMVDYAKRRLADAKARIDSADAGLYRLGAPVIAQPITDLTAAAMRALGV